MIDHPKRRASDRVSDDPRSIARRGRQEHLNLMRRKTDTPMVTPVAEPLPCLNYQGLFWSWVRVLCNWEHVTLTNTECARIEVLRLARDSLSPRQAVKQILDDRLGGIG